MKNMIFRIERQRFIFATQLLEETEKKKKKDSNIGKHTWSTKKTNIGAYGGEWVG